MPDPVLYLSPSEEHDFLGDQLPAEAGAWPRCNPEKGIDALIAVLAATRAEILVTCWSTKGLPEDLRQRCPDLRYICHLAGTIRGKIPRKLIEDGLQVTNWGPSISPIVAEHALVLILSCLRNMSVHQLQLHAGGWSGPSARSLFDRRVGLHGFGAVARALVLLLAPFRCKITAFAPGDADRDLAALGVTRASSVEDLYAHCDVLACVAPLTPETRNAVTRELLALLPDGAVFVNVGRGEVVDEVALAEQAGRLAIGLDVYREEPLPASSRLRGLPQVVLTPHIAGPTEERRRDAGAFSLANIRRFRAGQPLQAVITPERYDRQT